MEQTRQILMPGDPGAATPAQATPAAVEPQRRKPGPRPRNAQPLDEAGDDAGGQAPTPDAALAAADFTPEQLAVVQRMISEAVRASKASQDPGTAARLASEKLDTQKLPTQAAAAAMCEDSLNRGVRPRSILTVDGWYTHPEMARTKAPGVSALGGAA